MFNLLKLFFIFDLFLFASQALANLPPADKSIYEEKLVDPNLIHLKDFEKQEVPPLSETLEQTVDMERAEQLEPEAITNPAGSQDPLEKLKNARRLQPLGVRRTEQKYKIPHPSLEEIKKSGTQKVQPKMGAILIGFKDNKRYKVDQSGFVFQALNKMDANNFLYIIDRKGEIKYTVAMNDVVFSKRIHSNLNAEPSKFVTYKDKIVKKEEDQKLDLVFQNNLYYDAVRAPLPNEVVGANEDEISSTLRYQIMGYTKWDFPINVGLAGDYLRGNIQGATGEPATLQSFYVGPIFRVQTLTFQNYRVEGMVAYQKSFFYEAHVSGKNFKFDGNVVQIGLEGIIPTVVGEIALGVNYRRQWIAMKPAQAKTPVGLDVSNNQSDSLGVSVGYLFEFQL